MNIPQKPKKTTVQLCTNYFEIKPMIDLQKYIIQIEPDIKVIKTLNRDNINYKLKYLN